MYRLFVLNDSILAKREEILIQKTIQILGGTKIKITLMRMEST